MFTKSFFFLFLLKDFSGGNFENEIGEKFADVFNLRNFDLQARIYLSI